MRLFTNTVLPSAPQAKSGLGPGVSPNYHSALPSLAYSPSWSSWYVAIHSWSKGAPLIPLKSPCVCHSFVNLLSPCSWFWHCCDCCHPQHKMRNRSCSLKLKIHTQTRKHTHTFRFRCSPRRKGTSQVQGPHMNKRPTSNPHFHSASPVPECDPSRTTRLCIHSNLAQMGPLSCPSCWHIEGIL